jgi:hypothetical protein
MKRKEQDNLILKNQEKEESLANPKKKETKKKLENTKKRIHVTIFFF